MKKGTKVMLPDGTLGTIEYQKGNWYGVRQGKRIDEWQWFQIEKI